MKLKECRWVCQVADCLIVFGRKKQEQIFFFSLTRCRSAPHTVRLQLVEYLELGSREVREKRMETTKK